MLLVGDVGATKTDVAVLARASNPRSFLARRRFHSADYRSLTEIARQVMGQVDAHVSHACFDVAGPVVDGRARLTNLPWDVSAQGLRQELGLEGAWVINDLVATAHAIALLQPGDLHTLSAGRPVKGGAVAVIAPGTGLGEAFLVWEGNMYRGYPSEGGHADFALTNASQVALLGYLQKRCDHVSYELVCSGLGIAHLYDFFRDNKHARESPDLAAQLSAAQDRTPLIIEHAVKGESADPLCAAALHTFVCALGSEAGNPCPQGACNRWRIYRWRHCPAHRAQARRRTLSSRRFAAKAALPNCSCTSRFTRSGSMTLRSLARRAMALRRQRAVRRQRPARSASLNEAACGSIRMTLACG